MQHAGLGHVDDREACGADPQATLEVLGVEEELLVEQPGPLDGSARDRHPGPGRADHVAQPARLVGAAEAGVAASAEDRVEGRACVPELPRVGEEHLAGEHARVRADRGRTLERGHEPILGERVVVQQQHPVGAAVERAPYADVVARGEAEVDLGADQLDLREALGDCAGGVVVRAVVDADRLDPTQRLEARERVLASVPGEDDRDQVHQGRRVKCAIDPASGRRSSVSSSRSISPTSRAIPG